MILTDFLAGLSVGIAIGMMLLGGLVARKLGFQRISRGDWVLMRRALEKRENE